MNTFVFLFFFVFCLYKAAIAKGNYELLELAIYIVLCAATFVTMIFSAFDLSVGVELTQKEKCDSYVTSMNLFEDGTKEYGVYSDKFFSEGCNPSLYK